MRRLALAIVALLCACDGEAERAVRQGMLDPEAANFRDVARCDGDRNIWHGSVNGKNEFGAYTGFKSFYYSVNHVSYVEDADFLPLMERCFSNLKNLDKKVDVAKPAQTTPTPTPTPERAKAATKQLSRKAILEVESDSEEVGPGRPNLATVDLCWMDYCPCDTNDPDYGGADIPICRNLEAGLTVPDRMMSSGAAARDARRQLRENPIKF